MSSIANIKHIHKDKKQIQAKKPLCQFIMFWKDYKNQKYEQKKSYFGST